MTRWCCAALWLLAMALPGLGCHGPQPPPFQPVADVKELMQIVIDPAADAIWESTGTFSTRAGVFDKVPRTQAEWDAVRTGALTVAESGNLLMMSPRAKDTDQWMGMAKALVEIGTKARMAADAKDAARIFDIGAEMDEVCENCHGKYIPDYNK